MTSYRGLPERNIKIVQEFRDALQVKVLERDPLFDPKPSYAEIEKTCKNQGEIQKQSELKISGNLSRAHNWISIYNGYAEVKKLSVIYNRALEVLSADEINNCRPEGIKDGSDIGISRYEAEKNQLIPVARYLVPERLFDLGLF